MNINACGDPTVFGNMKVWTTTGVNDNTGTSGNWNAKEWWDVVTFPNTNPLDTNTIIGPAPLQPPIQVPSVWQFPDPSFTPEQIELLKKLAEDIKAGLDTKKYIPRHIKRIRR